MVYLHDTTDMEHAVSTEIQPNSCNHIGELHQQRVTPCSRDVAVSLHLPRLELLGSFSSPPSRLVL